MLPANPELRIHQLAKKNAARNKHQVLSSSSCKNLSPQYSARIANLRGCARIFSSWSKKNPTMIFQTFWRLLVAAFVCPVFHLLAQVPPAEQLLPEETIGVLTIPDWQK